LQQWNWVSSHHRLQQLTVDYINALPAELGRVVNTRIDGLQCQLHESELDQGWVVDERTLRIRLSIWNARRLQANVWAFRWASGALTTPTLVGLIRTGIMAHITPPGHEASVARIGKTLAQHDSEKTLGNIWGALHLLELQGWAVRQGKDADTTFHLTPLGHAVLQQVKQHWQTLQSLTEEIPALRCYHALCHNQHQDPAALQRLRAYVRQSNAGWGLPVESGDPYQRAAAQQLVNCLDGLLMGAALVAMGMPVYDRQGARITQVGPSALHHLLQSDAWTSWEQIPRPLNRTFVETVFDWLVPRDLAERDGERLRLTVQGRLQLTITPPLAALGISYLKSYEFIDDLLLGSGDPCGVDRDAHVDRVMNVYGSSGAGSGPASVTINERILNHYFNELPLHQQPAGIADIGCGDGSSLKRLADYVIQHTRRGQALSDYPLMVIGADYNEAPLQLTRETLAAYDGVSGVRTHVVKADISNPDAYNASLEDSGITLTDPASGAERPLQLGDLLHTYMFLIHNRRLRIHDVATAHAIIGQAFAAVDKASLRTAYTTYFNGALPQGEVEALAALLDAFDMSFSGEHGLVPGVVAVADLVDFMLRWKPYANHGLISLEGHSPSRYAAAEQIDEDTQFLRADLLPHPLNWGMHFQSRQFMLPFNQYMLAMTLAGYRPHDQTIYGGINPPVVPTIETLAQHRFFSIGCYVPQWATTPGEREPADDIQSTLQAGHP